MIGLLFLKAFYYFLPAYISNASPPLFQWVPFLDKPVDFGRKIRGKRILGDNKTFRGFLVGIFLGTLFFYFQKLLYNNPFFQNISIIDYSSSSILLGFLLSFGVLFADSVESFFKRRRGIPSGKSWFPFDQLDYVFGALIFSFPIFIPELNTILALIVLGPILQLSFHYAGYLLRINKDKI
ncbi:MAG: CDP-archaeol synthase [Nanoarchaeota archaeon]|nr:CDP-archaeol synthase [Nanoarchaeota archaeon]